MTKNNLLLFKLLIAYVKKHSTFIPPSKIENLHSLQDSIHNHTHQTSAPTAQDKTPSWTQNQVFGYVVFQKFDTLPLKLSPVLESSTPLLQKYVSMVTSKPESFVHKPTPCHCFLVSFSWVLKFRLATWKRCHRLQRAMCHMKGCWFQLLPWENANKPMNLNIASPWLHNLIIWNRVDLQFKVDTYLELHYPLENSWDNTLP